MKRFFTILLIFITFANISANERTKNVQRKAGELFLATTKFNFNCDDSTVFIANQGIKLCKGINDLKGESYFHGTMVLYYIRHGLYDEAQDEVKIIESIANKLNDNDLHQFTYLNYGDIFTLKEMYINALENYHKALKYYNPEKSKVIDYPKIIERPELFIYSYDSQIINIRVLANIAYIMRTIGNTEEALLYLNRIKEDIDKNHYCQIESIMPKVKQEFAYSYALSDDNANAEKSFLELIEMLKVRQIEDNGSMFFECYEGLATIYIKENRYDEAKNCIAQSKKYSDYLNNPHYKAKYHNLLGLLYCRMGEYEKCIEECSIALSIDSTFYHTASFASFNIARAYDHIGNKDMADRYYNVHNKINFTFSSRNYQNSIAELNEIYESRIKDRKIAELTRIKHFNELTILSFTIIFVMIILFVLIHHRINKKKKLLLAADSLIEGEINERKRISSDIHDRLIGNLVAVKNKITQCVEEKSEINKMVDDCIEEVRDIAHNIMPPSLKYNLESIFEDLASHYDNVSFHYYGKNTNKNERQKYCLFCIASELINNAERHSGATQIDLQLIENNELISIGIQDNGCGFNTESTPEGFGLRNIRDRIEPYGGTLTIESEPGAGTEVTLTINNR